MKRILNIIGVLFLAIHFALLFIYCMPNNESKRLKLISSGYAYPLYEQGWDLFAPAPLTNYRLSYRYELDNGKWSEWIYPIDPYHEKHNTIPMSVSGRHVLAEYNVSFWLHSDLYKRYGENFTSELKGFDEFEKFRKTFAFKSYQKYISYYASKIPEGKKIQGRLEIGDVRNSNIHSLILPSIIE